MLHTPTIMQNVDIVHVLFILARKCDLSKTGYRINMGKWILY